MKKILIIEDDEPLRTFLTQFLKDEGYIVESEETGSKGMQSIQNNYPHLVILDLGLPDISGETILKNTKNDYPDLPVIVLTAKSSVDKIVAGLNLGADDYLAKPFSAEELLARIKARLRTSDKVDKVEKLKNLTIDFQKREVFKNKKQIHLTKTEFDLLTYLVDNKNRVLTQNMILNHVWGYDSDVESRVVDVYISYLRKKLGNGDSLIKTKRGVGYIVEAS